MLTINTITKTKINLVLAISFALLHPSRTQTKVIEPPDCKEHQYCDGPINNDGDIRNCACPVGYLTLPNCCLSQWWIIGLSLGVGALLIIVIIVLSVILGMCRKKKKELQTLVDLNVNRMHQMINDQINEPVPIEKVDKAVSVQEETSISPNENQVDTSLSYGVGPSGQLYIGPMRDARNVAFGYNRNIDSNPPPIAHSYVNGGFEGHSDEEARKLALYNELKKTQSILGYQPTAVVSSEVAAMAQKREDFGDKYEYKKIMDTSDSAPPENPLDYYYGPQGQKIYKVKLSRDDSKPLFSFKRPILKNDSQY